jgi:hypothetical protein
LADQKEASLSDSKKAWALVGIVLLVLGASISLIGYAIDSTYCKSLDKILEGFFTNKVAFACPSGFYLLLVIAGAIVSVVGIIILVSSNKPRKIESIQKPLTSAKGVVAIAIVAALLVMIYSVFTEYVPANDITSSAGNSNFTIFIQRPSTILIPVSNIFNWTTYPLKITVFYDTPPIKKIDHIRLSTSTDSILSYSNLDTSTNTTSTYSADNKTANSKTYYTVFVKAKHSGQVSNTTNPYSVDLFYTDSNGRHATYSTSFGWPIKTLDFNILVYFFIVFIGVVVSRYTSNLIEQKKPDKSENESSDGTKSNSNKTIRFNKDDGIWILVSGVITLLIFSSFQEQVELTTFLLTNISLAFTFGFGFDKILETGSKITGVIEKT